MTRIARIVGGSALVLAGVFMLVLPGPGIITIVAGLALLSKEVTWAERLADKVRARFGVEAETSERPAVSDRASVKGLPEAD